MIPALEMDKESPADAVEKICGGVIPALEMDKESPADTVEKIS